MVVLRVPVLLQSAEPSVPTRCVPQELKQPVMPKREMWEREGVAVIFGSEQLRSSEVRESTKTMGQPTNGGFQFHLAGTHNLIPQSNQAKCLLYW